MSNAYIEMEENKDLDSSVNFCKNASSKEAHILRHNITAVIFFAYSVGY